MVTYQNLFVKIENDIVFLQKVIIITTRKRKRYMKLRKGHQIII